MFVLTLTAGKCFVVSSFNGRDVHAIPDKAVIQEIGTMALLPGVLIPVHATEKLWSLLSDGDKVGGGCDSIDALSEPKNN